jgi:tetratricopeptide (TPR) repeat protein
LGQAERAIQHFNNSIRELGAIHKNQPRDVGVNTFLRNAHHGRATTYERLGQFSAAAEDWLRAAELSPERNRARFQSKQEKALRRARQPRPPEP